MMIYLWLFHLWHWEGASFEQLYLPSDKSYGTKVKDILNFQKLILLWRNSQNWTMDSCLAVKNTLEITVRTRIVKLCRTVQLNPIHCILSKSGATQSDVLHSGAPESSSFINLVLLTNYKTFTRPVHLDAGNCGGMMYVKKRWLCTLNKLAKRNPFIQNTLRDERQKSYLVRSRCSKG